MENVKIVEVMEYNVMVRYAHQIVNVSLRLAVISFVNPVIITKSALIAIM